MNEMHLTIQSSRPLTRRLIETLNEKMDILTILTSSGLAVLINVIGVFWIKERLKLSIKHEYDQDLERLKNDLEFELDKKKKLYEGKLNQYKRYFSLIDSYSQESRKPLFVGFEEGIYELISNPSDENTIRYIKKIFSLQGDISQKFLVFKNEINGLRLEAGEVLLSLLDEYILKLEVAQNKTVEFMSSMNNDLASFVQRPDGIQERINSFMDEEFQSEGEELKNLQEKMFREMRRELGIV